MLGSDGYNAYVFCDSVVYKIDGYLEF